MLIVGTFILAPIAIVVAVSFNRVSFVVFPPRGFSLRWYQEVLSSVQWREAVLVSLEVAAIASLAAVVIGTLAAFGLSRGRFKAKELIVSTLMSPIVIPGLILGLAMLFFFANLGWLQTKSSIIFGHMLVTFPYVLRIVLGSLVRDSEVLEEAAMSLGADELKAFWFISVPLVRPAILGGFVFAFIMSFDNVTLSIFLASSKNITLPIRIYEQVQQAGTPVVAAISTLAIGATLLAALILDRLVGLDRVIGGRGNERS